MTIFKICDYIALTVFISVANGLTGCCIKSRYFHWCAWIIGRGRVVARVVEMYQQAIFKGYSLLSTVNWAKYRIVKRKLDKVGITLVEGHPSTAGQCADTTRPRIVVIF